MASIETSYATENDIQWIIESMENSLVSPFQKLSVKQLFEIASWSLISRCGNENKAYAAFLDYPYNDHYSKAWFESVENVWEKSPYHGVKTLFLHFLVCESNVKAFLEDILKVTFRSIPSLEWCCILTDGSTPTDSEIEELFRQDNLLDYKQFKFWSTNRSEFISKVGIRRKQSEDYLSFKNMFSQMYGPFKNDTLKKYTLDFLDYGEDKCSTYKYFTFDDDNTYIGVADNDIGEAVGFIYATIQRIDLDLLNHHFQLETVYGLKKVHPADQLETSFQMEAASDLENGSDEEDELRVLVTSIVDEVVLDNEVYTCLSDILDEVCQPFKKHLRKKCSGKQNMDTLQLMNSDDFSLLNHSHTSLATKNIKHLKPETLIRLVNSFEFDVNNEMHMKLVPRLGKAIKCIEENRLKAILNSKLFDPSTEDFASISIHVLSYVPDQKLELFKKSQIGYQIYEKIMYQKALEKKNETTKTKRNVVVPKLSFKDTQIMLHHAKTMKRKTDPPVKETSPERGIDPDSLKRIQYRNMGFIAGLAMRGKYRIQGSFSIPKLKEPFGYEEREDYKSIQMNQNEQHIETFEKYPVPEVEKIQSLIQEIPLYYGGTNCFYIEQFAIENDYEYQSLWLVMSGFEYFPRVDYCILLLPYGTQQLPYLRSYFHTVPARPFCDYGKELFIFHKAAFDRSYDVNVYTKDDLKGVMSLIQCSCLKEYLLKDLENSLTCKEKEIQAVVLVSEGQIFGVAVVKELKEVEIIRKNYDIAERINMKYHKYRSQGQLLHCVLHPIFKYFSNMFLKEVMRLCEKSILYYKVYPTHLIPYDASLWQSLCNVLEHFVPLKQIMKASHKIKSYIVFNSKDENEDEGQNCYIDKYYCLCYTCTKLILRDKNIISSRIVIIGDSSIAFGILESLIFRYDYRYTNVTIISKCGIQGEFKLDEKCNSFLLTDIDYTRRKLDILCLPAWVTIIRGEVISIKRNSLRLRELSADKSQCFSVGFEYLVICNDLQFQTLYVKKSPNEENRVSKRQRYSLLNCLWQEHYIIANNASNVFSINNAYQAAIVLNWLWSYFLKKVDSRKQSKKKFKSLAETERDKKEGRIVIYGNFLEAYTALAVLIMEDFPLSKITFVKVKSSTTQSTYPSEFVEEAIDHVLAKSGIEVVVNATIEYDKGAEEVFTLDVTTEGETSKMDCCALLLFHKKEINHNSFKALHKSSLSFTLPVCNSKQHPYLLINTNFQTNRRNIFAVGTSTEMYSTAESSVRFEDCFYNKREIGMVVGENVHKIATGDPYLPEVTFPVLTKPDVTYAKLPNKYFYIFITSPSSRFASKSAAKKVEYRVESLVLGNLNTGAYIVPAPMTEEETNLLAEDVDSQEQLAYQEFLQEIRESAQEEKEVDVIVERIVPDEPDYFALTFDDNENIQTIECLTKHDIDVETLKYLHGVHVTQLYKIIQKVQREAKGIQFRLAEDWILTLDHVVFEDDNTKSRKRGYDSYWRLGYPKVIENRLNAFLDSFGVFKVKNK